MSFVSRRNLVLVAGALGLAACGGSWKTDYAPLEGAANKFRLAGVSVSVPHTLSVSESESQFVPNADIVWREEPEGDRYAQVQRIFEEGVRAGAQGLRGATPVRIEVTVTKFQPLPIFVEATAKGGM